MTSSNNQSNMLTSLLASLLGALVLVGGALALAIRQGAIEQSRQEAARQAELRNFHAVLLDRVESLAEKSGMLTSADLCPVQFRLRFGDGLGIPTGDYIASATLVGPEFELDAVSRNGTLEFGLLPPASYRLHIATLSYSLQHDFEVIPGVPVDRLILCPNETPPGLSIAVEMVWPEPVGAGVIAVCEIEPDAVTLGGWTWQPVEPGIVWVVPEGVPGSLRDEEFDWIAEEAALNGVGVVSDAPYRWCRLRAIRVYSPAFGTTSSPSRISTCVFGNALHSDDSQSDEESPAGCTWPTIVCRDSAPTYAWPGGTPDGSWQITAPDELVSMLPLPDDDSAARAVHKPAVEPVPLHPAP